MLIRSTSGEGSSVPEVPWPAKALDADEVDRMWRVVDTGLSAHSILRDRYRRRSRALTLLVAALSIAATAFALVPGTAIIPVREWRVPLATGLGVLTATIFFLALADLVLNWDRLAWGHKDAVRRLGEVKAKLRSAKVVGVADLSDADAVDLRALYNQTMADVIEIPERQFLRLKAKHNRKVAVSRLIDSHPGGPLWYLRLLAMLHGLRRQDASGKAKQSPDEPVEAPPR
jgi:hypothetical protein